MWIFKWDRAAVSLIFMACFGIFAWVNIETQREHILVNTTGIEVTGRVILKGQTMQPNGRGNTWVNAFIVHYFDEPTEIVREPVVLEVFGKEIVLSDGRAAMGDFYSYEIENISDEMYEQTAEGDQVALLYLPDAPNKVWLKATVAGKVSVDPTVPRTFIAIGLMLALVPLIDWASIWRRVTLTLSSHHGRRSTIPTPTEHYQDEQAELVLVEPSTTTDTDATDTDATDTAATNTAATNTAATNTAVGEVGKLAHIPGIVVTDHYEDDLATYISFVLKEGQEEAGIRALVRQMEIGHAVCLSEYAGENLYHYVRKTGEGGDEFGYELLKSDLSASGKWEPEDYEGAIWWLIPVADQNLKSANGIWPATYRIPPSAWNR